VAVYGYAKVFDTLGSVYGPTSSPSYDSSALKAAAPSAKTTGAALSATPEGASGAPVNSTNILPQIEGTLLGSPVGALFVLIFAGVGLYYLMHRHIPGLEKELATPRVGLGAFFSIGFQATVFIVLAKIIFTKYRIPGVTEVIATA
jgi:hypothetical protein